MYIHVHDSRCDALLSRRENEINAILDKMQASGFELRNNMLAHGAYVYAERGNYERFGRVAKMCDKLTSPFLLKHYMWAYYYFVKNGHKEQADKVGFGMLTCLART